MNNAHRTLVMLAAGVVLLMAATLAADVVLTNSGIRVLGPPPNSTGAVLYSELQGSWPQAAAIHGSAPSTGAAVYGNAAGGVGVRGASSSNAGVLGFSSTGTGGVFLSEEGYGVYAYTTGFSHWDHGVYASSNRGHGVYASSTKNKGVYGVAGISSFAGFSQPAGARGVVGIGVNGGVYGSCKDGFGVHGISTNGFAIYGDTNSADHNYGFFTPDNLYSANLHTVGAIMQVAENVGTGSLELGDLVAFRGIRRPEPQDALTEEPVWAEFLRAPVVQVAKASSTDATGVAGVVFGRYVEWPYDPDGEHGRLDLNRTKSEASNHARQEESHEISPLGPAQPGDLVLIVVHGPAEVRLQPYETSIEPGDLLVAGGMEGHAVKALLGGDRLIPTPGAVFGKALERINPENETIYAFVTLQ